MSDGRDLFVTRLMRAWRGYDIIFARDDWLWASRSAERSTGCGRNGEEMIVLVLLRNHL